MSTVAELSSLFENRNFQAVLERAKEDEITPASDPECGNIIAASLFQLGRYADCLLWCEELLPALQGNASFSSMYGAVLRRMGRLDEAENTFRRALEQDPNNPFLLNNFANLLIDMSQFGESEKILKRILEANPEYEDARANLNRLNFQKNLLSDKVNNSAVNHAKNTAPAGVELSEVFSDPLAAAFTDGEVAIAGGINETKNMKDNILNLDEIPERNLTDELQEAIQLARQTIDSDARQALKDCEMIHNKIGVQSTLYEVAGEAYISLRLFADAEVCLLTAHSLNPKENSVLLNLANLAAMRGDQRLAIHWLEKVATNQPDHPQLDLVTKTLFPKGSPKISQTPFQINLEQRAEGSFS